MKKILLTGASGFLGGNFCHLNADKYEIHAVVNQHGVSIPGIIEHKADITNEQTVKELMEKVKPDALIYLAALSDPNQCQLKPEQSLAINVEAAEYFATEAAALKIPALFASTDLVFDGRSAPYSEKDMPKPVNSYGLHKAIAEASVLDIYPEAVLCRFPLMFGNVYTDANSFIQPMIKKLGNKEAIPLFTDEYRSPLSARSACEGILVLLEKGKGIYHLAGAERISRYKFGERLCHIFGLDNQLLNKSKQKDVAMPAPRPKDVSLIYQKAVLLGWQPRDLGDELTEIAKDTGIMPVSVL